MAFWDKSSSPTLQLKISLRSNKDGFRSARTLALTRAGQVEREEASEVFSAASAIRIVRYAEFGMVPYWQVHNTIRRVTFARI